MTYKSEKLQSAVKTVFFRRAFKANAGRSDYGKQGYTCPVREPAAPSTLVDLKLHIPHSIELVSVGKPVAVVETFGVLSLISFTFCCELVKLDAHRLAREHERGGC
jgi:hypothetical protein